MVFLLEAEDLFHSLQFATLLCIGCLFVNCGKKGSNKGPGNGDNKNSLGKVRNSKNSTNKTNSGGKKEDEEEDVQFDVKIKPKEEKKDEFDDDEENPLAKIPTKNRVPKQKGAKPDSKALNPECPILGLNEKQKNASCYLSFLPMVSYKLTYFPTRGNGEIARQVFAFAGQEFVDERIPKEEWDNLKHATPFGQLPVLHVDGKQLAQSIAIVRYLSRQFGIAGKNAWEEAQVDALADQFKDYRVECRPFFVVKMGFKQGDVDKLHQEIFLPSFRKNYGTFQKSLATSGNGFLVGDSLTWIDLSIAQHSADLLAADGRILDEFPEMLAHQKRIHAIPNIKKWIETRPVTSR